MVCGFLNKLMNGFIHYRRQVLILWQKFQTITLQISLHLIYWLKSMHILGKISVLLTIRQI